MVMNNRTRLGVALAVGVIGGRISLLLGLLLLAVAGFLIAWDQNPKRTQEFFERVPYGPTVLRALSRLDSMIS
jgi:hypothetical protein